MALDLEEYVASLEPSAADREQAKQMAMWNAAAMLIGGGPNRGQNIAQAMLGASQGYQTGLEQARRKRLADLQSIKLAQDAMDRERAMKSQADFRSYLSRAAAPTGGATEPEKALPTDVRERRRVLLERAAERAEASGDMEASSRFLAEADKLREEYSLDVKYDQEGRAYTLSKSGKVKYLDGVLARDKLVSEDLGGKKVLRSEYSAQPVAEIGKTMTPGEIAVSQRAKEANEIAIGNRQREIDRKGQEDVDALRKEFSALPQVKSFTESVPYINSARKAPDTPAGDFALIYGVGKILDPNSVVREGEMNLVIKAGSPAQRVQGFLNHLRGKGQLTPEMREQLTQMLNQAVSERQGQYEAAKESFTEIAASRGYKPDQIFVGQREVAAPSTTTAGIPPPAQRQIGKSYDTPKGRLVWLGNGQWGRP